MIKIYKGSLRGCICIFDWIVVKYARFNYKAKWACPICLFKSAISQNSEEYALHKDGAENVCPIYFNFFNMFSIRPYFRPLTETEFEDNYKLLMSLIYDNTHYLEHVEWKSDSFGYSKRYGFMILDYAGVY